MKKYLKIFLITVLILFGFIILDTIQALIFNNNPLIGLETKCMKKEGIFVDTYHCEKENITRLKTNNACYYEDVCNINNKKIEDNLNEVINSMKATINGKEYIINLEDNETSKAFINLLPIEFNMNELNGNEKYIYMDLPLPTNSVNPKYIEAGDVMLYGDNCLVIFYKSFDTSYSYTRIGHIDNLDDLGKDNVEVKFER